MKYGELYKGMLLLLAIFLIISVCVRCFLGKTDNQSNELIMDIYQETSGKISIENIEIDMLNTFLEESINEIEIMPEIYSPYEGIVNCYFTNTEGTIDEILSINAQKDIVVVAQNYLDTNIIPARELYCIDNSITEDDFKVSFQVRCVDAGDIILTFTFNKNRQYWSIK